MNNLRNRVTTQLLRRRMRALSRHLPGAMAGDDRGVHQARVATRRLREAVPVLAMGLKRSKAGKAERKIRRLTRALGTVRELDVTLLLLDRLMKEGRLPRTALDAVRIHVMQEREQRRTVMLERLTKVKVTKLGRRLDSVAQALEEAGDDAWREVLMTRVKQRGVRLRSAIEEAGQMYGPERLHQVRIAAKKLRYGLELASESGLEAATPMLRPIKRSQETLGEMHDLQILGGHIATVQAGPGADLPGMHTALEGLALEVEGKCRHLHGRYLMSAAALREVSDEIQGLVYKRVITRPRPLKMVLAKSRKRAGQAG